MCNTILTAEQERQVEQMCVLAKMSAAAEELAKFCHIAGVGIELALPMFTALAERKLKELSKVI